MADRATRSGRNYSSRGGLMDGEYPVRVHLAGDGHVHCSLVDDDGECIYPGNIEYIETECFLAEEEAGIDFEDPDLLTPEPERESPAPVVGTAVYDDGILRSIEFDFSTLPAVAEAS